MSVVFFLQNSVSVIAGQEKPKKPMRSLSEIMSDDVSFVIRINYC